MLLELGSAADTLDGADVGAAKMTGSLPPWAWPTSCGLLASSKPGPSLRWRRRPLPTLLALGGRNKCGVQAVEVKEEDVEAAWWRAAGHNRAL